MKKVYILLCLILLLSGCTMGKPDTPDTSTVSSEPSTESWSATDPSEPLTELPSEAEVDILGKYICSSDYCKDEYLIRNPSCIPAIAFYDDGSCKLTVNYLEGVCDVEGSYTVEGSSIYVGLDFRGTIFAGTGTEYMDDQYVFSIADNSRIIIDRGHYSVDAGDTFTHLSAVDWIENIHEIQ